jgi:hypothetical protein
MTPREQLIEAIAHKYCERDGKAPRMISRSALLDRYGSYADFVVHALSDLGAVILLPLKAKELKEGQEFVESQLNDFVGMGKRDDDGGFFCWNTDKHYAGDDTVYIHALESEQS